MPTESPVDEHHPIMKAWKAWQQTDEYRNSHKWAQHGTGSYTDGSLWKAFFMGWTRGTGQLEPHGLEPPSDPPDADAMGAELAALRAQAEEETAMTKWCKQSYYFPLLDGRMVTFQLPAEGLTREDADRAAHYLRSLVVGESDARIEGDSDGE